MNTVFFAGILGLQGPELIIIFILVLLLFGAKKLPQLARGIGKSMGEFRRAKEEFESEIHRAGEEVRVEPDKKKQEFSGAHSSSSASANEEIVEPLPAKKEKVEEVAEKSAV